MLPTFAHPALLAGLALVAVPVLIHLLSRVRRRPIEWAAMEFLLASQQQRKRKVWMEEWLLLLLRMLAIAGIVLVVAQPVMNPRWAAAWGTARTHYVVLLDDSYSMADRGEADTAFDQARGVVERLGLAAAERRNPGVFTLLRFSRAPGDRPRADLLAEPLTRDFPARLADTLRGLKVGAGDWGPGDALAALAKLLGEPSGERRLLYLVSDFRQRNWHEAPELLDQLRDWTVAGGELELVQCADAARANLALTRLELEPGILAAGVPARVLLGVTNWGTSLVENVPVELAEDDQPRPSLRLDRIGPGQTELRRVEVAFGTAGPHAIEARLPGDPVVVDNTRYAAVEVPLENAQLVVAADDELTDAAFLARALAPGGTIRTGLTAQLEPASRLDRQPLERWSAVWLADPGRLSTGAIAALESYLEAGGRVVVFVGPQTDSEEITRAWYRDGESWFPTAVGPAAELIDEQLDSAADLVPGEHPMFRVFAGQRNSFLASVVVQQYLPVIGGAASDRPPYEVLARLRNDAPLVLRSRFGRGQVVAVLTSAAPDWNNWARNPSYVVALLELAGSLASQGGGEAGYRVGEPIELELGSGQFQPAITWQVPGDESPLSQVSEATATGSGLTARLDDTARPGIYRAEMTALEGPPRARWLAVNVEPGEGDLTLWAQAEREESLGGIPHRWHRASQFSSSPRELAGWNLTAAMLLVLVGILVGEQLLAYRASHHRVGGGRPR